LAACGHALGIINDQIRDSNLEVCNSTDGNGGDGGDESETPGTGNTAVNKSIFFAAYLGKEIFPGELTAGRLSFLRELPSDDLATPQGLNYTYGTRIIGFSSKLTVAGEPREVYVLSRIGEAQEYRFEDGESEGWPQGIHRDHDYRLVMVDSNGLITFKC